MCSFRGCDTPGDKVPQITFILQDIGPKRWELPATFDFPTCAACRPRVLDNEDLSAGAGKIVAGLLAARPGSKHVDTQLEWVELTHPDYLKLKGLGPS
jgi:hypothetical protein